MNDIITENVDHDNIDELIQKIDILKAKDSDVYVQRIDSNELIVPAKDDIRGRVFKR
ncbi:4216_t:CDS:2 [Gigaspora rosea]|nr:4216_t:CDS:2 [Gigaspora rosea]